MAIAEVTDPGLLFRYSDAHEFTTKAGLCRKAGVKEEDLLKIVAKELTDNALDAVEKAGVVAETVRVGLLPGKGFFVQDGAGGFSRDGMLEFWRVDRGYTSSKRLRLPTRGALGNGLRVVAGAVIAFGAALTVHTQGVRYRLELRAEGGPVILEEAESSYQGTRIEISFPDDPLDEETLEWANRAVSLSSGGYFPWKTSPYWYTAQDLHEILKATADGQTVASVVAEFDGCSGAKAGMVVKGYRRVAANSLSLVDAETILSRMREVAKPFNHRKMNKIGDETAFATGEYEATTGVAIPFSVSVWASPSRSPEVELCLNRSPFAADCWTWHNNSSQMVNLPSQDGIGVTTKKPLSFVINISSPLVPFTSDGKAPDLSGFFSCGIVQETVRKATTRAKVRLREPRAARKTQKEAVFEALPEALRIAGGGYAFSQRQAFYAIRPLLDSDLDYGYFCDVLTKYEAEFGEVENLYRDNRGSLIIPHTREEIPVGTLSVANFKRPEWTFSRILYVEKQGFFPLLKSAGWLEKWDCALISSSGYASRAVKDLIDALGSDGEPIEVFALHDADGPGTCIPEQFCTGGLSRSNQTRKAVPQEDPSLADYLGKLGVL